MKEEKEDIGSRIQAKMIQNRVKAIRYRFNKFIKKGFIPVITLNSIQDNFEKVDFIAKFISDEDLKEIELLNSTPRIEIEYFKVNKVIEVKPKVVKQKKKKLIPVEKTKDENGKRVRANKPRTPEQKVRDKENMRKYREKNPEHFAKLRKERYERNKAEIRKYQKEYYDKHRDKEIERSKRRYEREKQKRNGKNPND